MKKVSKPFKRPDKKSYWLLWRENGRRHAKSFNTLDEAKMFRKKKYIELNMDVYGTVDAPFELARDEYLKTYDLRGLSPSSKLDPERVLRVFAGLIQPRKVSDINQKAIDTFTEARMKADLSRWTVNKDLGCLKAFIRWLIKRNYHNGKVEINFVKAPQIVHKALTDDEIKVLLKNCPTQTWKMRILLSLCTGLRAGDIDRLEVGQIDLQHATLTSISRKTGKTYQDRPIPFKLVPTLSEYTQKLPENTVKLLPDINIRKTWEAIRLKAGLPDVTRQMFRVTFSVLIQKVGNIKTAQQLLEHYDRKTTEMFYSDESIIRWKIEQLPVKRWLFYCK